MKREELKKALEDLNIWCVTKNVIRKGKLDKYSILELLEIFEEIGIKKISGVTHHEVKVNKNKFNFYIENKQINSFIGCTNICGFIEIPFNIKIEDKYHIESKIRVCVIINFE